jgi:hypothetical protein
MILVYPRMIYQVVMPSDLWQASQNSTVSISPRHGFGLSQHTWILFRDEKLRSNPVVLSTCSTKVGHYYSSVPDHRLPQREADEAIQIFYSSFPTYRYYYSSLIYNNLLIHLVNII